MVTASHDSLGTAIGCFTTITALLLAFIVSFLFDQLLADGEVLVNLFCGGDWAIHPWVGKDLLHCGSLGWVESHHLLEEVLELRSVDVVTLLSFRVSLPEDLWTSSCN